MYQPIDYYLNNKFSAALSYKSREFVLGNDAVIGDVPSSIADCEWEDEAFTIPPPGEGEYMSHSGSYGEIYQEIIERAAGTL